MDDTDYSNPPYIPQPAELASYLRENRPNDRERDVLLAWYAAPDHIARTQEIADALGLTMLQVNNAYGRLGRRVVNALDVPLPERTQPSHVLGVVPEARRRILVLLYARPCGSDHQTAWMG